MIGTSRLPIDLSFKRKLRNWPKTPVVDTRLIDETFIVKLDAGFERRKLYLLVSRPSSWQEPAKSFTSLVEIFRFVALSRRLVEIDFFDVFVTDWNAEAIAELHQLLLIRLLDVVSNVATFAGFSKTVSFDGLSKDDCRRALVIHRGFVGGVDFFRIVTAAVKLFELVVRQMLDHLLELGSVEEVLADVRTRFDRILLVLPVDDFAHASYQDAVLISLKQLFPQSAPDDFDDVPAGASEGGFEFLNNLAVASNRTIESLQVAVHNERQVVEVFS